MPGIPFSVRVPAPLAAALDQYAETREWPRSYLVERIIRAIGAANREAILKTKARGAPTEKLNLRLSSAALAHLKDLAGDLPPAEFLRRAVARQFPAASHVVVQNQPGSRPSISIAGTGRARGSEGPSAAAMMMAVGLMVGIAALLIGLYRCLGDHPSPGSNSPGD